jgi:hypothetical protein
VAADRTRSTDLMTDFTIVTDDGETSLDATRANGSVRLDPAALPRSTGWDLKPEGLCCDDVCVPVRDRDALVIDDAIDLRAFAEALRRPLVVDDEVDLAVLGASTIDRAAEREGLRVSGDLALRDLDGNVHHWNELGHKKKLLFAWASW